MYNIKIFTNLYKIFFILTKGYTKVTKRKVNMNSFPIWNYNLCRMCLNFPHKNN